MSDKLLKDGLRTSDKIGGVSVFAELLFVRLLLATCGLGRCPWNPDWILTHALPNRPRTRPTAIAEALQALLSARLVARYHAPDGTAYLTIPNHGQRFKHAIRSPWPAPPPGPPDVEGQTFMGFPGYKEEEKRRGEGAPSAPDTAPSPKPLAMPSRAVASRAHATPSQPPRHGPTAADEPPRRRGDSSWAGSGRQQESDLEWIARLTAAWPGVDIETQLAKAHKKRRGDVERGWFESVWLPGVTPMAPSPSSLLRSPAPAEPTGWRETLEELFPGNAISPDLARTWASVDASTRDRVLSHQKQHAA
jgi:hypothetical protein